MNDVTITVSVNGEELSRSYKIKDEELEDTYGRGDYFGQEVMSLIETLWK